MNTYIPGGTMSNVNIKGGLRKSVQRVKRDGDLIVTPRFHSFLTSDEAQQPLPDEHADIIRDLLTTPPRDRRLSFSPSSLHRCERRQVFAFAGFPQQRQLNSDLMNLFADGTWRHLRLQATMLHAGILDEVEKPIDVPKYRLKGSIDGIGTDEHGKWILEAKGMHQFQFDDLMLSSGGPKEEHIKQGAGYSIATNIRRVAFFYECKGTQKTKEFDIDYTIPAWSKYIDELGERLERLNKNIFNMTLPPILTGDAAVECKSCPFLDICSHATDNDLEKHIEESMDDSKPKPRKVPKPGALKKKPKKEPVTHLKRSLREEDKPWRLRGR